MNHKKIGQLLSKLGDDALFAGKASDTRVAEIENILGVTLPKSYQWFLRELGNGGFWGTEILGNGPGEAASCVQSTLNWREYGLPESMVVIEDVGEFIYCLDTSKMKRNECPVVDWAQNDGMGEEYFATFEAYFIVRMQESITTKDQERLYDNGSGQEDSVRAKVKQSLQKLSKAPKQQRNAIIEMLTPLGEECVEILSGFLTHANEEIRIYAALALLLLDAEKFLPLTLPLLQDQDPLVRSRTAEYHHDYGDKRSVELLQKLAQNDPNANVRYWACYALAAFGNESILPLLEQVVRNDAGQNNEGIPVKVMAKTAIRQIRARMIK